MRVIDHTPRFSLSALLVAGCVALSALPAPAFAQEGDLGDAPVFDGNDASAQATTEAGSGQGNNADAESGEDTLTSEVVPPEEGFIERAARAFTESDLVFARSFSNAPFLPVAFLGSSHYGDATVSEEGATPETAGTRYQATGTSQYAGVPFLLSKRSMAVLGEYVSYTDFSVDNGEDFSVTSASIAAGYLYQVNPDWQVIAALVPFYNHSSLGERGKDYWQVMGGAVARYTRNDRLWWLFGVVFDDSDFGTSVLPYLGASLTLTERWSVSAILPWPQVMYAPSKDWFVSLGASYSGNSWAVNNTTGAVGLNLSGFDLGFGGGMRLKGPLWLEGAVG
ncbi:MAG: hypothetical protein EBT53_10425, partial [Betaproteobacteria bacterium]|nr:hypothetical protein [Candidatus Fonsibacter lacus]